MKKLLLMSVLSISPFPGLAGQAENGIYERSQDTSAALVRAQDGELVRLGTRRALQILKAEIFSENNENTRFRLSVTVPYDPDLRSSSYILFVDGTAYQQRGAGSSQKDTSSASFYYIMGDYNATQVAKYFGAPLRYRKHPGYDLQVSFTPSKQEFDHGEEVIVTLRITNVGTKAVSFIKGGRNRGPRDNQYTFSATYRGKQVEDVGPVYDFGGIAATRILRTGDVFEDKVNLRKWFPFKEGAGLYEIHGSYYLGFQDPDDDSWRTIWDDYASRDFAVTIKERSNK